MIYLQITASIIGDSNSKGAKFSFINQIQQLKMLENYFSAKLNTENAK